MSSRPLDKSELEARWRELLSRHGLVDEDDLRARLDLDRIADMLRHLDELEHRARQPEVVELAIWFSGAERLPAGLSEDVGRLLEVLKDHDPQPDDPDGQVLSDADLAILSAPPDEYAARFGQRDGSTAPRLRQVNDLLARDSIYRTPEMRAGREARAQLNLARERVSLTRRRISRSP